MFEFYSPNEEQKYPINILAIFSSFDMYAMYNEEALPGFNTDKLYQPRKCSPTTDLISRLD